MLTGAGVELGALAQKRRGLCSGTGPSRNSSSIRSILQFSVGDWRDGVDVRLAKALQLMLRPPEERDMIAATATSTAVPKSSSPPSKRAPYAATDLP